MKLAELPGSVAECHSVLVLLETERAGIVQPGEENALGNLVYGIYLLKVMEGSKRKKKKKKKVESRSSSNGLKQ